MKEKGFTFCLDSENMDPKLARGEHDASASLATIGLAPLGPSGIIMDTAKAMSILGFSSSTTFEATSMDEINHAFMHKLHLLLRPPRVDGGPKKRANPRANVMTDRKMQMRKLNEALQFLIKKRTKSKATEEWKFGSRRTYAVAMAIQALDEQSSYMKSETLKEQVLRERAEREEASKQALALAEELVAAIESIDAENRLTHKYVGFHIIYNVYSFRKVIITLHHGAPLSFWQTTVVYDAKNNTIKYRQAQPCCNSYARKNTANTVEELLKVMAENDDKPDQEVCKPTISVEPYDSDTEQQPPEMPLKPHMKAIKSCGKRIKPCPASPKKPKRNLDNAVVVPPPAPPPTLKTEKHIKLMSKQFQRRLGISTSKKSPNLKKRTEASISKHIQANSRTNTLSSTSLNQSQLQAAGRGFELYQSYAVQLQHQALTRQISKRRKVKVRSHREKKYSRLSHAPISTKCRK